MRTRRLLPTVLASAPLLYFVAFFTMMANPRAIPMELLFQVHAAMCVYTMLVLGVTFVHAIRRLPAGEKTPWLLGVLLASPIAAPAYWWMQPWTRRTRGADGERCPTCQQKLPLPY